MSFAYNFVRPKKGWVKSLCKSEQVCLYLSWASFITYIPQMLFDPPQSDLWNIQVISHTPMFLWKCSIYGINIYIPLCCSGSYPVSVICIIISGPAMPVSAALYLLLFVISASQIVKYLIYVFLYYIPRKWNHAVCSVFLLTNYELVFLKQVCQRLSSYVKKMRSNH